MTEEQYIAKVPALATWNAEARAQFVEGMNTLNGMAVRGPRGEMTDAVGVLVLGPGGPEARYVRRALVLEMAEGEEGFPAEALAELQKPPPPGELRVLVLGLGSRVKVRLLLSIPGRIIPVPEPGSEGN